MRILTIRSVEKIPEDKQLDVHYAFGMERHTDYVFKDKYNSVYSATINLESTENVIEEIVKQSEKFPGYNFVIDDLDLENNRIERYKIISGEVVERLNSTLEWNNI
ncbi:MAG: hypothetical protein JXR52_10645 [Bacteroidales bacterium]|nr:hypothetical protein [Bacteroidales bacterium]